MTYKPLRNKPLMAQIGEERKASKSFSFANPVEKEEEEDTVNSTQKWINSTNF